MPFISDAELAELEELRSRRSGGNVMSPERFAQMDFDAMERYFRRIADPDQRVDEYHRMITDARVDRNAASQAQHALEQASEPESQELDPEEIEANRRKLHEEMDEIEDGDTEGLREVLARHDMLAPGH